VSPLYRLFDEAAHRDPLYLFLPLLLSGALTAFVFSVQWFVGLRSDRNQSFQQHQSTSKGATR
jgi:hypothetical protein